MNKKKRVWLIIGLVIMLILMGGLIYYFYFKEDNVTLEDTDAGKFTSEVRITSNGLEDFDLSFLKLENNEENIVYSPLSIKYAFRCYHLPL